jgi:ribosomal protein S18 acetylase RimI-like enzyme
LSKKNDQVEILPGGFELLDRVAPLWRGLRAHHASVSVHFSDQVAARPFEDRRRDILSKADKIHIDIACVGERDIGYCIATMDKDSRGELDSMFIEPDCRRMGLGRRMAESALEWLKTKEAKPIILTVMVGNDEAERFWKSLGFYPRNIQLHLKD